MDEILERMAKIRVLAKEKIKTQAARKEFFHRCLSVMLESGEILTEEQTEELLKDFR